MARKIRVRGFYDETWKANIWIVWPVREASLNQVILEELGVKREAGPDDWGGKCLSVTKPKGGGRVELIALRSFDLTPERLSTLAHECFHAAEYILEGKVQHSEATSEVFAYLTDSIMRRALRVLSGKKQINEEWK